MNGEVRADSQVASHADRFQSSVVWTLPLPAGVYTTYSLARVRCTVAIWSPCSSWNPMMSEPWVRSRFAAHSARIRPGACPEPSRPAIVWLLPRMLKVVNVKENGCTASSVSTSGEPVARSAPAGPDGVVASGGVVVAGSLGVVRSARVPSPS